jgi:hypothetical protein
MRFCVKAVKAGEIQLQLICHCALLSVDISTGHRVYREKHCTTQGFGPGALPRAANA